MEQALHAVVPATTLQTCIVHLIRNSLSYASWKDRRALAAALKPVYTAKDADAARQALHVFADGSWGQQYPMIVRAWESAWDQVIPFFVFPPAIPT